MSATLVPFAQARPGAASGNKKGPGRGPVQSGAGNGTRTRECQLGKLMPYHLAMPAQCASFGALKSIPCRRAGWQGALNPHEEGPPGEKNVEGL